MSETHCRLPSDLSPFGPRDMCFSEECVREFLADFEDKVCGPSLREFLHLVSISPADRGTEEFTRVKMAQKFLEPAGLDESHLDSSSPVDCRIESARIKIAQKAFLEPEDLEESHLDPARPVDSGIEEFARIKMPQKNFLESEDLDQRSFDTFMLRCTNNAAHALQPQKRALFILPKQNGAEQTAEEPKTPKPGRSGQEFNSVGTRESSRTIQIPSRSYKVELPTGKEPKSMMLADRSGRELVSTKTIRESPRAIRLPSRFRNFHVELPILKEPKPSLLNQVGLGIDSTNRTRESSKTTRNPRQFRNDLMDLPIAEEPKLIMQDQTERELDSPRTRESSRTRTIRLPGRFRNYHVELPNLTMMNENQNGESLANKTAATKEQRQINSEVGIDSTRMRDSSRTTWHPRRFHNDLGEPLVAEEPKSTVQDQTERELDSTRVRESTRTRTIQLPGRFRNYHMELLNSTVKHENQQNGESLPKKTAATKGQRQMSVEVTAVSEREKESLFWGKICSKLENLDLMSYDDSPEAGPYLKESSGGLMLPFCPSTEERSFTH